MAQTGTNQEYLKSRNTESVKEVIYKYGPISRSEVAKMLRLTPPTITTNVANLIRQGLVRECAEDERTTEHTLGRKRVMVEFVSDACYAIGVVRNYLGVRICLVDLRGDTVCEQQYADTIDDYDAALDALAADIEDVLQKSGIPREKVVGVGIGLPGFVDGHMGLLRYGTISKWSNKFVAKDLARRTGFPCRVENNARCCAIGEELFSKTPRPETFAYFMIARGLACPLVIRNRLHSGEMAGAGEIGHVVADRFGPVCPTCGNRGCLEGISSELAIRNRCIEVMQAGIPTLLAQVCKDPADPQIEEILQVQKSKDPVVCSIMENAVSYLGITLANIINFVNPPLVIVDGHIMQNKANRDLLLDVTRKNLFSLNVEEVNIEFVPLDRFRAAKGAAALAIKKFVLQEGKAAL